MITLASHLQQGNTICGWISSVEWHPVNWLHFPLCSPICTTWLECDVNMANCCELTFLTWQSRFLWAKPSTACGSVKAHLFLDIFKIYFKCKSYLLWNCKNTMHEWTFIRQALARLLRVFDIWSNKNKHELWLIYSILGCYCYSQNLHKACAVLLYQRFHIISAVWTTFCCTLTTVSFEMVALAW